MDIEASQNKVSTFCKFFLCPEDMDDAMEQEFSAHLEVITPAAE